MADEIGHLGLDTKDFEVAVNRVIAQTNKLNATAGKTDTSVKMIGRTMSNLLGAAGITLGLAGVIAGMTRFGRAVLNLGESINAAGDKLQGSQRFENIKGAAGGGQDESAGMAAEATTWWEAMKAHMTGEAAKLVSHYASDAKSLWSVGKDIITGKVGVLNGGVIAEVRKRSADNTAATAERGAEINQPLEAMRAHEGYISDEIMAQTAALQDQHHILEEKLQLKGEELDYYSKEDTFDRNKVNAAKEAIGTMKLQLQTMDFNLAQQSKAIGMTTKETKESILGQELNAKATARRADFEHRIAVAKREGRFDDAEQLKLQWEMGDAADKIARSRNLTGEKQVTREMQLQVGGMESVAKAVSVAADDAERIAAATRDQNDALVETLQKQQGIHNQQARVEAHNLTPDQLRDERRTARKFARDDKKALRQESDLTKRLANAGLGPDATEADLEAARKSGRVTRGSRLDRFAAAQVGKRAAAADQAMTVKMITATTLNVTNFQIANM